MSAPYYADDTVSLHHGHALDVLRPMPDESVECCVTSPPYFGLRDYGVAGQIGLEPSPAAYVAALAAVMTEVRRVLTRDGTCWLNLGDSYSGKANAGETFDRHRGGTHKAGIVTPQRNMTRHAPYKGLLGIPWRTAFACQDNGWTIRNAIVWQKPNAMPESVQDRLTASHELVFLLTRSPSYWFDLDAIRSTVKHPDAANGRRHFGNRAPAGAHGSTYGDNYYDADPARGRNPGDVWAISTQPFPGAHFATMPIALAERCIIAGCKPGGTVLDPFSGAGTTGLAATRHGRRYVGIDINADYLEMSLRTRLAQGAFTDGVVPA